MRKIFLFMMVSVDGFFEGEKHDLSWHNVDDEFNEFAIRQLHEVDMLLFGRKTYEMMADYWPSKAATTDDPIVSGLMNQTSKLVISHDLRAADWNNTQVIHTDVKANIEKIKAQPGKDMAIFGSNNLCVSLMQEGLVDEFRIMVNPVAVGQGSSLFTGLIRKFELHLIKTQSFASGNVLLTYQ